MGILIKERIGTVMKIGTLTFHGSHNYGSVLQAYALQTFVVNLCEQRRVPCDYKIINYRSEKQRSMYSPPKANSVKNLVKRAAYLLYKRKIDFRNDAFERFISERLRMTEAFSDSDKYMEIASGFDVLIAGSDQIWNVRARDFDYAYLFEGCSARKISYAVSFGPLPIDWKRYDPGRFAALAKAFDMLSVRECASKDILAALTGNDCATILPDPVFLCSVSDWRSMQSAAFPGRYILFYCLEPSRAQIRLAKRLSKQLGFPVVSAECRHKNNLLNPFVKRFDAGPCDFLSLVDHAELVLTASFHGTAFSLIYGKPFYVVDGMSDARIRDLLTMFGAERNSISPDVREFHAPLVIENAQEIILKEREKARSYFIKALGIVKEQALLLEEPV